jgi:hypothetical protein
MPQRFEIPIAEGFYEASSSPFAEKESVNLYPFSPIAEASSQRGLLQTHGITEFSLFNFAVVAEIMHQGVLYCIAGNTLYSVTDAGVPASLGSIGTVSFTPQMASNGEVLCIQVPTTDGFFYDTTNGFRQITDPVYVAYQAENSGVLGVTSIDGYFVMCTEKTLFHSSSVLDVDLGTTFPALAFATGESRPDDNVRPMRFKGDLILFGTESYEIWRNIGTEPFAFARIDNATQDKGLKTYGGVTQADNSFFFIGSGPNEETAVWRASGGVPQKISTESIDRYINSSQGALAYSDNAWSYSFEGHIFVGFPINASPYNRTFVYDVTESAIQQFPRWHRRSSNEQDSYTVQCVINAYGKIMAGCNEGLGYFDESANTEFGGMVERKFSLNYVQDKGNPVFISELELRAQAGVGSTEWDAADANKDPSVLLRYSDDFTASYVNKGTKSLGKNGNVTKRLRWRRFGRIDNMRVFEFSITTAQKVAFVDLIAVGEGGRR